MTGFTYVAIWPIDDQDRPMSVLMAEAGHALSMMAAGEGVVITGQPEFTVSGERLVCIAPAKPWELAVQSAFDSRDVSRPTSGKSLPGDQLLDMRHLVEFGHGDREVAERLGVSAETVRRYRKRWAEE